MMTSWADLLKKGGKGGENPPFFSQDAPELHIDIETFSDVDLPKCGVYKYAESPAFEVLLFAYAYGDEPVRVIDLTREKLPAHLRRDLLDPAVVKTAFNANFERVCLSQMLGVYLPPESWKCTRILSLVAGLPSSLKGVGEALDIEKAKLDEGRALIRFFCMPCKPTAANGERTRNRPEDAPEDWQRFITYCARDVEAEREIEDRLAAVKISAEERALYCLDQRINDRGVQIDAGFVSAAISADFQASSAYLAKAKAITGLANPASVGQMKGWLFEQMRRKFKTLTKADVKEIITDEKTPDNVREALRCRQMLAKTSVAKYQKMLDVAGADGRIRGLFQFYGANRTGRFAGRLVQLQNLPRNKTEPLDLMRELVVAGDTEGVEMLFSPIPFALSELVRTALVASPGSVLTVSDFSAIEARVLAWLAGESWMQEAFATHGKIYEATASQMFHVPIESVTKGSDLRQKGKVASLACGYGGGVGALKAMGADKMGLTEREMQDVIMRWRIRCGAIVRLWGALETAALTAVSSNTRIAVREGVECEKWRDWLTIALPSGRRLFYYAPRVEQVEKFGRMTRALTYSGVNAANRWVRLDTYGGKLAENVTQAVARDCLCVAMQRLEKAGFSIVAHVHDEVIIDGAPGILPAVNEIMARPIKWAPDLILKGDGYETEYYRKD